MAVTQEQIDAAIASALKNKRISVDGLQRDAQSLDDLRKFQAAFVAETASASKRRPVLYQRMRSASGGDSQ